MGNPLQTLHKSLLDNNYDVPEDYNSFERTLTAKGDEGYQNRFQLWKSLRDNNYDVPDNYDDFRDTLFTARQPEPSTYKPTAREMAGFQQTIGQATQAGQGATAAYDRRASNLQKRQGLRAPQRVTLGESNNLVEGEQHLNPGTGEFEQSYITSAGNEYQNKTIADQEQRQIDQAMRDERYRKSLPGQLDDAYAERDRLNAELAQHQGQWVDQDGRVHYGNRGDDESVAALEAALRQNQQRITALEAERDDDGGTQFWRGFVDAAMNPSVQTFGLTDFNDMVQLMRVKQKIDQAHDAGQEPELSSAEQKLIESTFLNNDAQQKYGENRGFMYRAGGISMQALPFVAEFMTTGGFSALSEAGAKYGTMAAEKMALQGLSKMFVKNLGVLAGDVAAGWAMANTTGAFRTASDIMQRNMGEVTINPEGQYDFGSYDEEGNFTRGGKSLGRSIYEAEVANTLEYYTEKLGEHLQLGKWIAKGAEKMGLSKLSKAVNYLSSSKWLESGGIQDYPSEVVEEQANLVLNALLVGDNDFSTGEKGVFNAKTQADIWGGMLFSIGLMQAPRLAYTGKSAINYYQAKKTVDMADTNASIVFGEDNWASVKQQIDDCDNEQMGDMIASIATGDMNSTEKTAALNYAGDLLKMRGYNMGMMADAKDEQSSMSEEAIVSQSIDQSYGQGYNAQVPDEMKQIVDDAQASGEMLSSFGEEFSKMVMDGQEEPVQTMNYLMQNRDLYTDEQIAAAADYFQKQAAANGVMDAALDNVDMQVEQANAQIRGNAHQESGNLVMAKMGDQDYYVVGGEITPDGVLVGTGGAVLLKDPITGEVSVQSPANVMVYEMTPVDELIQQNETVLRQQLTQQADDDINFGSPANEVFDMEDTVTLNDGNGGVIEGQVVQLPNAVDGVFVIQTSDGRALQMTADDMNRRIVAHNGMEVQRASMQPDTETMQPDTETIENQQLEQKGTESVPTENNQIQPQPQPEQGGETAGGEASAESGTGANEQPASALSRIPVKTDASGQPVKGKNGRPVLEWHKATVEDAASALIETAGGDMLTARDTASDLVNVARGKLEKIRKQKPKGEDPIEIAESRQAIKQQEQEQQAIIKQWQDVNQDIQRRMQAEAAERQAAIEAAKSEEQRQREAEEARKLKEQQEEQDRKRLREQIEKDKERRNKQYEPLVQARREMADDAEALSVLEDIEPRSLDEYVSSLLRPHSMLWQDASDSERGLQTELGLKRSDMQRMMTLLGTKESGAKPFGQVVLDIHEGLPQGMKDMYTDEDVRNTLLDLFNEGSSTRMLHLTEEHRIEEARQMKEENQRRAEEAEMDAWAEAYHLTPEEREAFEAYMQEPPTLVEQEVINQIIADNEQNRTSPAVGEEPVSGAVPAGIEGSQSQVQTAAEAEGGGNIEEGLAQGEEAASNQPSVSDDDVSGTVRDRESLAILFDQIGASPVLAERMSDYDVEQLTALVEDWEIANDEYGQVIERNKDALKSKNKDTREAAQKAIDDAQEQANVVFEPIEEYVEGLNVKYGIESEEPFEGAIPTPKIDKPRYDANRQALIDAYKSGDPAAITAAAQAVQQYVDEGLDAGEDKTEMFDIAEDYNGNDPEKLADQYIIRTFWDRYLDDDADQEYIKTGLKPDYTKQALLSNSSDGHLAEQQDAVPDLLPTQENNASFESKGTENISNNQENLGKTSSSEEISAEEGKVDTNPSEGQKEAGNYQKGHIKIDGYDITIENPKGSIRRGTDASGKPWETEMHNTYGYIRGTEGVDGDHIDVFLSDNPTNGSVYVVDQVNPSTGEFDEHKVMYGFASEEEARQAYLSNYSEGWQGLGEITEVSREDFKKWVQSSHRKTKPFAEYKSVKKPAGKAAGTVDKTEKKPKEHKRIVSDDQMEELRKKLLEKFNQANAGIDVERMLIGAMYAVGKIERGVTKFADYAAQMVDEIGDAIRPYLKSFYNAVRDMPEAAPYRDQMDDAQTVEAFDVFNFDKGGKVPDAITKAGQVVKQQKAKKQVKKIMQEQPSLFDDMFADSSKEETKPAQTETKPAQTEIPAKPKERKLRPATEADLESEHPIVYLDGHPWNIIAVMRSGEQISATQFSKPKVDSVMLTNGKSVKLEDLMVEDESAGREQPKPKTPWWNDPNRPQSLDPSDYRTYMTDEARNYFAGHPAFSGWKRKDLAFVTAAVWDGIVVPYEALKDLPEIVAAEQVVKDATVNGVLQISDEEVEQHAQRLLDAEHGSAVFDNGKIKKVNGVEDFSGPVRQERKALVIIGYPAAGKSSVFANRLSNELGARIIDSDVVKPWLEGFDGGNGAGFVQNASSEVAERAIDIAVGKGDNIILPRIGGNSVIMLSAALKLAGYDVQLYFNDVATVTSVDRATSRFAESGRYLSLQYLTSKDGVPSKNFSKFAEENIGDYINELSEGKLQELRGRLGRLLESETVDGKRLWESSAADQGGYRTLDEYLSVLLEPGGTGVDARSSRLESPIFSYAEWKSNDVAFGEKPKEIWNSKSGKPMPGKEKKNNGTEQKVSRESRAAGEGAGQASRSAYRAGAERSPEQDRAERSGLEHPVETPVAPNDGREVRDTSGGPSATSTDGFSRDAVSALPKHNNRRNNVGERGKDYAPLSPKARFNANVEAIKMMRELMEQGVEVPTKDQMEVLRQYSGWGGLGTYFNDDTLAENKTLRDLLTEEEYHDAALSIKTAYYTPATVIDTLWDIAKAMGFKGGNVLEGSAGIGNIIGQMPKDMSRRSDIEAVELDPISGNILKLLYPDAKVNIQGFQDTTIRNGSVDLAITNVPFAADISVIDKVDKDLSRKFRKLHDFCIAKNIRKLKEGGIGIFITTSGTLDKSTQLREWITDEGQSDVIGAFRLNNKTFGGTPVTSDIIVVRKRDGGRNTSTYPTIDVAKASPLRVGTWTDKYGDDHQVSMTINDYFKQHPEMMAGEMAFAYEKGETFRPGSYGLYPVEGKDQDKMLKKFVKRMQEVGASVTQQRTEQTTKPEQEPNQLTAVKEGRMLVDDKGRLCVSQYGEAVPLSLNDTKVKGYTKKQCFEDYQAVQKAVDDVLQQQLNDPDDTALEPKLDVLNKAFDQFVKRYGNLHKNTAISFLRNDIDFPSFQALENYSETKDMKGKVTVTTSKTPLFRQRVLGFKTEPQPKTVKDALIASVFRSNGIDLDWIAEKLGKDREEVRKGIIVSRLGFEDPSTGQLEISYKYLSGNVREKLAIAEAYNTDGRYNGNIEELRKVIPMDIPAHLIDFSLGSSWIPVEMYKDYLKENYDLNNVKLAHVEGSWVLDPQYSSIRNEKNRSAGVYSEQFRETIYGHQLVAAALNNRPVKVAKQVSEGYGSSKTTKTIVDQKATQACAVRVDEIKDDFKQWAKKKMQEDPELSQRIEKIYNDKFNALVPMEISDEFLPDTFENANVNIHLYGHQKRGVMRGVTTPTMLAHEVGTGKSFTLITTAMEMRRLGTAQKPMIVVQNATVAQMTADAKLLYPNAKILSLSEKDRSAEGRRAFYAKIKYNDWDLIIVPQSTFERIPDSPERELQFIQEKIDEKKHVIEAAEAAGMDDQELKRLKRELEKYEQEYGDKYLDEGEALAAQKKKKKDAKKEATSLDKAETRAKEQLDRAVDDVQYFDDMGVDALLVDEAHEYKHLGFQTSIGRGIKGVDPSYSKKCAGLYNKTRSVFEKAGWKNVVFATGTPISNTAAEIWTFMKYLMPADVMRANDIYYFDDFVHNFGSIQQMLEFTTSGKFKENTRFAAYVNKPELIRIWSQVADTVLTKEVGAVNAKIPDEEGGKDQDKFLPQSPSLISIMAAVRKELERFENMSGQEKKENSHIPLTMYGIAKRAAIDPRLVNRDAPDEPLSKTNAAVKEIVQDLKDTESYKGTVAVFCDNQNRKNEAGFVDFNIFEDMRDKLIAQGVPAEQIVIIKSGMSIAAKQKVFDAVNSGGIRVVLGSTQTLGTGVNMQERLHLLIHMDAPDRPMDYTQRNGRIKRQGNLHKQWGKTIRVIRFGVEDSLDVTAYQRLKTKSGFIDSIMDGKTALANNQVDRTVEEEEEGLFDNPVAVLSGSQYALKKNQAERELRKYQGKKAQHEADQVYVTNTLRYNKAAIEGTKSDIAKEQKQLERIKSMFPDGKVKTITVDGVKVDMTKDSGYGRLSEVIKEKINDPVNAIVKRNRENQIYNDETLTYTIELDGHPVNFKVDVTRTSEWDGSKMRNVIHKYTTYSSPDLQISNSLNVSKGVRDHLDEILEQVVTGNDYQDRITAMQQRIERMEKENEQLQERVGLDFPYEKELKDAEERVDEYTELMKKELEEKEAKYASQQTESVDLSSAEDNEEDEDLRFSADEDEDPIYSDAFKNWFGDWENDPGNASKVVDENGMPLVLFHATNLTMVNHSEPFWSFYEYSHFGTSGQAMHRLGKTPEKMDIDLRAAQLGVTPMKMELTKTYAVYLNIRNPKRVEDVPEDWDETHSEWWGMQIYQAVREGYDGIVYENKYEDPLHPADSWIAFSPEQIKSATDNIGTYDRTRKDIRYREQERFEDGQLFPIHTSEVFSSYNVLGRRIVYSTDLMPDEYTSEQSLLDAVRNQYPEYFATIEDGSVKMESWSNVMKEAAVARQRANQKNAKNFIERKTRNAIDAVTNLAERMNLNVELLTNTEGLTGKKARAKGWFNPKTGKITLVLPNHSNQSDLINTLLHEGVAHFGLRKMFGADFNTFLDNVYNNISPEIKARIDAAIKRNGWSRHEATEEYLARLAERTDFEHAAESGWWQKIKDFFFEMLGKAGFNTSLTDNELRYILWRSYDNLLHPDSRRNIFDKAREVQMQSRLRVGPYSERERQRIQRTGRIDTSRVATVADNINEDFSLEDDEKELFSIRTKEPPKKTGIGYKVFVLKDGQLYPPMVANPGGEGTPVGVWLDADAAPVAGTSKTGRPQVKAGGKGTQGGSGQLAYRPGWHLGTIPYALQFNRKDANGERTLFPNNFVWAEVEYADDVDYQDEARQEGINANGKYQHSLAGLKHVPTDGSYKYRTNPDPRTDEWIITGAMRVNKILNRDEVDNLVRQAGREPQPIQAGDILTQEAVDELNAEIQATKEADEMGLLMRDDSAWDDVAKESYEKEVATKSLQWQESWQDSMASLKAIQDAIAKESGHVATGAEDAYRYENRMHGRAKNMTEQYDWRFYRPMLKAFSDFCKAKGLTHESGMDYLIAKSGLERNVYYAFRDAVKSKLAEDIKDMREKLEKDYSKNRIDEKEYKSKKADIDLLEQTGVDDRMQQVRGSDDYLQAKEDYAKGDISYNEYTTRIEDIIRRETDGKYDEYLKDYSGLTETFNKEMYDAAQQIKKEAQRTIDPQERRELWGEYDAMMKQAYEQAREEAEKRVFDAESDDVLRHHTELWKRINAATEETLKHSYESGLMERNTYNKVRKMFDFYIPLRGWDENKASDVYTYMGRENVFSPAVKKTWGRTSKAEDPLAYIGNIAVSTILSGHRNMMKQHFLNYVMNNPTSLVSISESWYENIGTEDDHPVWVLRSADTAGKDPDEIAQIVSDFNEEMRLKQNEGKAIPVRGRLRLDVNATQGQKAEHVVEVQRAGRTYQLYINGNPKAAQALNGSTARAVSRISDTYLGRKLTALNRSMAAFFTSKNPAFVVSNLSRDLNMAGASVAINEGADYNARFIANVVKVLSPRVALGDVGKIGIAGLIGKGRGVTGLMPKLMSKWKEGKLDAHDETERLFKEFMDEGGETGFVNMLSVESFKEKMRKEIAQMNGSSLFGNKGEVKEFAVTKALRMLGDTFEFYNRCAEDATRFIVYMTSRQMGKTLEQSIADAKDVTLNFNRKGTGDMGNAEVRDLFIFVNPAIQALANMYRMAKGHPLKFGIVTAGFVVAGAMIPVINQWLLNMFGDDDDKDAYWNLPPWVRKNNLVFWVPGTKNFVTMPLAQEFRVFYGVGEMISSGVMDHPLHNAGLEVVSSVADLVPINPTGNGGNLLVDFAPTGVQPIVQIGENVDFTGKPIWKDNQGNKFDPMFSKAYVSTPKWMVKISEGINSVTGGDQDIRGWLERNTAGAYLNNPAVWNHLLQGYFGGMYNTIAKTFDVAVTVGSGEAPKVYQTPILNRFLNRPVERDNAGVLGEEYWKQVEDAEETMHNIRKKRQRAADGDAEAQQELEELLQTPDGKKAETVLHYKSIIDVLRKGERSATEKADKQLMKESISNYAQQMHDELMAIDGGLEPLDAAMQQFEKAKTIAEKKKLQKRIEKLMTGGNSRTGSASQDVDKAKQFVEDSDAEAPGADNYLNLATAEDIKDDGRIKAAKALAKPYLQHYKELNDAGKTEEASQYRQEHQQWFVLDAILKQQTRLMNQNKKLLGKGHDAAIMKLISNNRNAMLRAIDNNK